MTVKSAIKTTGQKVGVLKFFKLLGVVIIMITMGVSQFHRPEPIFIPKEMWTIIMAIITHVFMSFFPQLKMSGVDSKYGDWIKGMLTFGLLGMVCVSVILQINVGKEWWGALGVCTAFLYGTHKD